MRFAALIHNGLTRAAFLSDDAFVLLDDLFPDAAPMGDLGAFLKKGGMDLLEGMDVESASRNLLKPLDGVKFAAPVTLPPKIVALGMSYRGHAEEQKAKVAEKPMLFSKARTAVIGPDEDIVIPKGIEKVDYEVELCAVIGRAAPDALSADEAMGHVFGFTVLNDVSARDAQFGDRQWYRGKSYRTFAPTGPVVVTAGELDYGNLDLSTKVNGELRQSSNTAELMYTIPGIIAYISAVHPLEPGDLVATGTPEGVGVFRDPPVFLKPGDRVECAIQGIGTLANTVVKKD